MSSRDLSESDNKIDEKVVNEEHEENLEQSETIVGKPDRSALHPKAVKYIQELLAEKLLLDHLKYPHAVKLIDQEIEKIESVGRAPPKESKYIDINKNKPIRVTSRVLIPIKEYPKFNFIGKILGPKGHSLRRLQEETLCRILIQGRGSMRDPKKEQELLNSFDRKYNHLANELNVEVSAVGAPAEAHARMAYALAELKKYLTPDNTDYISIEQLEEIERIREHKFSYQEKHRESHSSVPFKKPAAATFREDRFYDTLNKAKSSIDVDRYGYNYSRKNLPYSTENYDDPKYANSYGDYAKRLRQEPQSSATFKKPAAAAFKEDRFHDALNKAKSSLDGDRHGYNCNHKSLPYSTENYDDPKYANSYADYVKRQGFGEMSSRDSRYKARPYDRQQE